MFRNDPHDSISHTARHTATLACGVTLDYLWDCLLPGQQLRLFLKKFIKDLDFRSKRDDTLFCIGKLASVPSTHRLD